MWRMNGDVFRSKLLGLWSVFRGNASDKDKHNNHPTWRNQWFKFKKSSINNSPQPSTTPQQNALCQEDVHFLNLSPNLPGSTQFCHIQLSSPHLSTSLQTQVCQIQLSSLSLSSHSSQQKRSTWTFPYNKCTWFQLHKHNNNKPPQYNLWQMAANTQRSGCEYTCWPQKLQVQNFYQTSSSQLKLEEEKNAKVLSKFYLQTRSLIKTSMKLLVCNRRKIRVYVQNVVYV